MRDHCCAATGVSPGRPARRWKPAAKCPRSACETRVRVHEDATLAPRRGRGVAYSRRRPTVLCRLLADAVLLLHLAFVVFVAGGALLVWRRPAWAWLHLPALAWGAWVVVAGQICPLTPLENALRVAGGGTAYGDSFIEHYLLPIVYPDFVQGEAGQRAWQVGLGVALVVSTRRCMGRC